MNRNTVVLHCCGYSYSLYQVTQKYLERVKELNSVQGNNCENTELNLRCKNCEKHCKEVQGYPYCGLKVNYYKEALMNSALPKQEVRV